MVETSRQSVSEVVSAAILIIGDEILSGRTKDRNIAHIAEHLNAIGIRLCEVRVVADEQTRIVEALDALRSQYSYVFTTGGIGPTHDDITADSVAAAFGVPVAIDPRAVAMMRERYTEEDLNDSRLRMARIPEGAELVDNPISKTPGFMIGNVIVMAGIPDVMAAMLDAVTPHLRTGRKVLSRSYRVLTRESDVADGLRALQQSYGDVSMGSYPFFEQGLYGTFIVLRSTDEARLGAACREAEALFMSQGLEHALAEAEC